MDDPFKKIINNYCDNDCLQNGCRLCVWAYVQRFSSAYRISYNHPIGQQLRLVSGAIHLLICSITVRYNPHSRLLDNKDRSEYRRYEGLWRSAHLLGGALAVWLVVYSQAGMPLPTRVEDCKCRRMRHQ